MGRQNIGIILLGVTFFVSYPSYAEIHNPLRRPVNYESVINKTAQKKKSNAIKIEMIMRVGQGGYIIASDKLYRVGDYIDANRLIKIFNTSVELSDGAQNFMVPLAPSVLTKSKIGGK